MTTKRQFHCDLCRSEIRLDDQPGGVGIRFSFQSINMTTLHDAESHLCGACLERLEAMFTDLRKIEKIRAEVDHE
jgi:hypothetical protein